ncbi:MAG: hypothetical protein GY930_07630, partial [bacterium]|nr:hypothetical protein [bacterium]
MTDANGQVIFESGKRDGRNFIESGAFMFKTESVDRYGDLTMAAKHLADAARLNPRSIPARWFGGRVAWLAGDKTKAQTLLTEARSLAASKA